MIRRAPKAAVGGSGLRGSQSCGLDSISSQTGESRRMQTIGMGSGHVPLRLGWKKIERLWKSFWSKVPTGPVVTGAGVLRATARWLE